MKKINILIPLLLFISVSIGAQNPYRGEINVLFEPSRLESKNALLEAQIDLSRLKISRNDFIIFSPRLVSLDGTQEIVFDPVTISGSRRANVLRREAHFNKENQEIFSKNFHIITSKNKTQYIPLTYTLPFEKWMRHSRLIVKEQTYGCYSCRNGGIYADGTNVKIYEGNPYVFPEPYQPQFNITYITPPVEEVKLIQESHTAQLQFPVNRSELLLTIGNNQRILAEVDEIIDRIRRDTLVTIRRISVRGYASPEGNAAHNLRLSQDRASAFVTYLNGKYNSYRINRLISSQGMGEDWDGLKKAITELESPDRYKVLQIIESNSNIERRKNALKNLTGSITYRTLLEQIYPPLRRNEYTITYEVRGFTPTEAKEIIRSRPQFLSLNEMFMVAHLYEKGTKEFLDVFDIAAKLYPESPVAQFNVAASEIEKGEYKTAIPRLEGMDTPEAINNLAIAYWYASQYDKALELFEKAAALGYPEAKSNLEEYRKWNEDRIE